MLNPDLILIHTIKSGLSPENHMLNLDLGSCEFTVTLAKSGLSTENPMLNPDLVLIHTS